MFRVKICGITSVEDARLVAAAGADAVGLNFFSESPRFLNLDLARAIVRALPEEIVKVGLFVNGSSRSVIAHFDDLGLDLIQLHGDERPEYLAELGERPVMRAFRLGPGGLGPILEYLETCRQLQHLPRLVLLDAYRPGQYGGTGDLADWPTARNYPSQPWHPPLVLAGGLNPGNIEDAIECVGPSAVDTASGVEREPGKKEAGLVRRFVEAARKGFDTLGGSALMG